MGAAFIHLHPPSSIIGSHLLPLPRHMSVFNVELYAASCALQYAASLSPPPKVISFSVDNQATVNAVPRPGYSYQATLLNDISKATSTRLPSGSVVQVGWTLSHAGITGNELADAAAKLAAEGTPSDNFPWSYSRLRSQIHDRLPQEWRVWHKPRDDFPFPPLSPPPSYPPSPRRHAPISDEASCLLPPGPSELAPPRPGALPTVRGGS